MPATATTSPSASAVGSSAELTVAFVAGFGSATTRSNETANLRDWFAWTEARGIRRALRRDVEASVGHLEQAGYAPNTICQRIATQSLLPPPRRCHSQDTSTPPDGPDHPHRRHGTRPYTPAPAPQLPPSPGCAARRRCRAMVRCPKGPPRGSRALAMPQAARSRRAASELTTTPRAGRRVIRRGVGGWMSLRALRKRRPDRGAAAAPRRQRAR